MHSEQTRGTTCFGERLYLRPAGPGDVTGAYVRWMNDPEVVQYLETRFMRHTAESLRDYVQKVSADADAFFFAVVLKEGDRHIGNIKLGPLNRVHRFADIGLMIGEKDCWGKGYAAEAIQVLSEFAFGQLKLHKLTASCYETNQGSARAFQKAGFVVEGVRKRHFRCRDHYVDGILLGKLNPVESDGA